MRELKQMHYEDVLRLIKERVFRADVFEGIVYRYTRRLKPFTDKGGYLFVRLWHQNHRRGIAVHLFIWMYQHEELIPEGYHVDHKDDNNQHNAIWNLQLLTEAENLAKRFN